MPVNREAKHRRPKYRGSSSMARRRVLDLGTSFPRRSIRSFGKHRDFAGATSACTAPFPIGAAAPTTTVGGSNGGPS